MMDATGLVLFVVTAALLALAPGPSTLLVLSHALTGDLRRPLSLMAGAFLGNLLLIAVTVAGLAAVVLASQTAFAVLRLVGAAYLIWLGVSYFRRPKTGLPGLCAPATALRSLRYRGLAIQAFLTSTTNPKGLVFYFAFLPQFATTGSPWELLVLGLLYLLLFMAALALYAVAGKRLAAWFSRPTMQLWKNRITGGLLMAAGLSLLRVERN